jgi:hypothetical protein
VTPHQALTVAVRLFAILVALYALREFLGFAFARSEYLDASAVPVAAVFTVVALAVVTVLWFFPRSIARGLLPGSADTPAPPSPPDVWIGVGSSVIGLWLIATALPGLFRNTVIMYLFRPQSALDTSGLRDGLLYLCAQLVVGILLVFGANGIRRLIVWAQDRP